MTTKADPQPSEPAKKPAKKVADRRKVEAAPAPAEPVEPADLPATAAEPDQPVRRAGGHIDRGDGRGWVLEEN